MSNHNEVIFTDPAGLRATLCQYGGGDMVRRYGPTILWFIKTTPGFCTTKMVHHYLIECRRCHIQSSANIAAMPGGLF